MRENSRRRWTMDGQLFYDSAVTERWYVAAKSHCKCVHGHTARWMKPEVQPNTIDDVKYALEAGCNAVIKPYSRYWVGMLTYTKYCCFYAGQRDSCTMLCNCGSAVSCKCRWGIQMLGAKGLSPMWSVCCGSIFSTGSVLGFQHGYCDDVSHDGCCWQLFRQKCVNGAVCGFVFSGVPCWRYLKLLHFR